LSGTQQKENTVAASDLVQLVIDAHGGQDRWQSISRFRAEGSIAGAIWSMKGQAGVLDAVVLEGETRDQRLKISPFPQRGRYLTWEPSRETIETDEGVILEERPNPADIFKGTTRAAPWDPMQAGYFAGEANWNYFVAPFVFERSDFATEEVEPWHEDGEVWRSLLVTYPDNFVAHCRQQTYYFDDKGLLRRLDYSVDILGGGPAVHYPSNYREFDGIMVPTTRRVYVRNPDGSPVLESVSIAIDFTDVSFS
jgi:hypothetical protein